MNGVTTRIPAARFGPAPQTRVRAQPVRGDSWCVIGEPRTLPGHGYGSGYPSLIVRLTGPALTLDLRNALAREMAGRVAGLKHLDSGEGDDWQTTLDWLLRLVDAVQEACDLPVGERASVLSVAPGEGGAMEAEVQFASCSRSLAPLALLLRQLVLLMCSTLPGQSAVPAWEQLGKFAEQLRASGFKGSNTPRFVRAAHALGMPFRELPGQFFRFGVGRRGHWMNSTFTERTGHLAALIARDKLLTGTMLAMAGMPVPRRQMVSDVNQALDVARKIGYPVVVKPADKDGGRGVAAGLVDADELRNAYAEAARHSRNILVEKHVEGNDYRLTVYHDRLVWAIERVPAGVTGNGRDNVVALVVEANADPRRGNQPHAPLKSLVLDAEADALLARQGLTREGVPGEGQFVRLRRIANVSSGGMPLAAFDRVHEDNARLAVDAARALRLDLAGIDLLIPDIARSWRETGAAICEVNGQPQLGGTTAMHLYPVILREEVEGDGRIPTLLVWGGGEVGGALPLLEERLAARGLVVGWVDGRGVRVGADTVTQARLRLFEAGDMLAGNKRVDVMVMVLEDVAQVASGLPVSRIDMVLDSGLAPIVPGDADPDAALREAARLVLPACDGVIVEGEGLDAILGNWPGDIASDFPAARERLPQVAGTDDAEALAEALAGCLTEYHTGPTPGSDSTG